MWRTVVVWFLPIKFLRTNASDITATSLLKLISSENSTRFGVVPSISTPNLGSQRKSNLLTILFFPVLLFLVDADLLNA